MDLTYTPEDVAFRQRVRAWLEANLPVDLQTLEDRKAWHRKLYEAGFVGMGWPKAYGGWEARPMEQAIVAEEMARARAPGTINGLGISIVGPTLIVHGTEAQKQRYLRKILTAEEIWCQLYSEPNAGSDLAALRTTAERAGDEYVVNGQKVWTSGGMIADSGVLLARTNPHVPKHEGISYFILDMHSPGVEVRPLKQITGSAEFNEVFMTNARVEKSDLIGRLGQGWEIAQTTLGFERGGNSMARVTRYASAFDRLVDAAKKIERSGKPLLDDPVVRAKLGRVYAEMEVQRYAALRVLSTLQKGDAPGAASSITKLSYSEFEKRYYELCLEVLGPYGQVMDGGLEETTLDVDSSSGVRSSWAYAFLWARAGTIYSGSSEIQKNVIGERVLGLPKEIRADRVSKA